MRTWWYTSSGASCPPHPPAQSLGGSLNPHRRLRRVSDRPAEEDATRPTHSPESSTWRADPARLPNAGAPSSEPTADNRDREEGQSEHRGGHADGDNQVEEEKEKEQKKKKTNEDGCLTDASFEEINRLTHSASTTACFSKGTQSKQSIITE